MAKVYRAPIEAPAFQYETWEEDEAKYIEALKADLKAKGFVGPYAGEIVQFPFADGHAVYMIVSLKPVALIHVAIGDAWSLPAAYVRGLTAKDLKANADSRKALEAIFKK